MNKPKHDLWRVAVHEAAHAVVARMFGVEFRSVTIVPAGDRLGACNFYQADFYCDRRGRILASMAGRAAEMEFFGSTTGDYSVDDESIADKLQSWPKIGGIEAPKLCERNLRRQARRLVKKYRAEIERVAQALLQRGTLTPLEVDAVIELVAANRATRKESRA